MYVEDDVNIVYGVKIEVAAEGAVAGITVIPAAIFNNMSRFIAALEAAAPHLLFLLVVVLLLLLLQ